MAVASTERRLPFFMKTFPCPACGASAEHRQFRSRIFGPGKAESDGHVISYTWSDPQLLQVHPPLYHLFFCSSCFYTSTTDSYTDPANVLYSRVGHKAFLAARSQNDPVIDLLGRQINYDTITFESALWMHLLAIYAQLLREEEMRDHFMIARLYLRVAWLFREEQSARAEQGSTSVEEKPEDASRRAVVESLRDFDAVLHQGHEGRDQLIAVLKADATRRGPKDAEIYSKSLDTIGRLFDALHSEAYRLKSTFNKSFVTSLENEDKSYNAEFLDKVKSAWVYAPVEEAEGLRSAIEHFEKAIANDARLNDPDPFFKTSALIIDLELRCNDLDAAFKKARGVVASVMNDRQNIQNRINKTENPSHKMELQKLLVAANRSVERASDLQYQIVDMVIERELPRIQAILKDYTNSTSGQKKVALLGAGVTHGIIHRLEERKMI